MFAYKITDEQIFKETGKVKKKKKMFEAGSRHGPIRVLGVHIQPRLLSNQMRLRPPKNLTDTSDNPCNGQTPCMM